MVGTLALFVFPLLMAYAASSDLLTMRIANRLVVLVVAAYLVLALFAHLPLNEIGINLAAAACVLIVAFSFFAFGWIGGGDAKLIAAISLWMGVGLLLPYLIYSALLGGSLTLMLLTVRRYPLPLFLKRQRWADRLHNPQVGVPYGITLAIAALLIYPQTPIFGYFIG